MTNRVQQRRSTTPGFAPLLADLLVGEFGLNLADKNVYYSTGSEVVQLNAASNIVTDSSHRFITDGQLATLAAGYTLPVSTSSVLGGVKIGANIDVDAAGVISIATASASATGVLSSADWSTFNGKQASLGYTPVNQAGDTMTGLLTLSGAPTATNHAATKSYVDTGLSAKVDLAGGTMSGLLILSADPVANLGAATKQYVDSAVSSVTGEYGAPVQSTADLTALTGTTDLVDKMIRLVEDNGSLYRYDSTSSIVADGSEVIEPVGGVGRWIKISAAVQSHEQLSNLQGGAANDHVHLTTVEKNGYDAHLSDYTAHLTSAQNTWLDAINASAAEVNYLVGVTSSVQTQLNGKEPTLGFTPVNKAGDNMLGMLSLFADPVAAMDAVNLSFLQSYIVDCGVF